MKPGLSDLLSIGQPSAAQTPQLWLALFGDVPSAELDWSV